MHLNGCREDNAPAPEPEKQTVRPEQCEGAQIASIRRLSQWIEPLQATLNAMTVREKNGELLITDGPFAETKEQLLGCALRTRRARSK